MLLSLKLVLLSFQLVTRNSKLVTRNSYFTISPLNHYCQYWLSKRNFDKNLDLSPPNSLFGHISILQSVFPIFIKYIRQFNCFKVPSLIYVNFGFWYFFWGKLIFWPKWALFWEALVIHENVKRKIKLFRQYWSYSFLTFQCFAMPWYTNCFPSYQTYSNLGS